MKNIAVGWLLGSIAAIIASVLTTFIFHLGNVAAFVVGVILGVVFSQVGMWIGFMWEEKHDYAQ